VKRKQVLTATLILMVMFSAATQTKLLVSGIANAELSGPIGLAMPEEYVNYRITRVGGTLWAEIDGTYPIRVFNASGSEPLVVDELPMVYPTPPRTTNIRVKLNGTELAWSNYTEANPAALHHTAVGDWPIILCVVSPVSEWLLLTIHYEHPLQAVNGSCLFLYDLNISPYLSPSSNSSTAYFTVRLEANVSDVRVFTTETDSVWNPKNFTLTSEDGVDVVSVQMVSVFDEPLAGDLVVMMNDSSVEIFEEFPYWLIIVPVLVIAGLLARYRRIVSRNLYKNPFITNQPRY
jgi:hypothetical protein